MENTVVCGRSGEYGKTNVTDNEIVGRVTVDFHATIFFELRMTDSSPNDIGGGDNLKVKP